MKTTSFTTPEPGLSRRAHFLSLFAAAFGFGTAVASAVVEPHDQDDYRYCAEINDIRERMDAELANPALAGVVHLVNLANLEHWSGTLIAPQWILTCAHTLQGTDGRGAGIDPGDIFFDFGDGNFDPTNPAETIHIHPSWSLEDYQSGGDIALIKLTKPVEGIDIFPKLAASPPNLPLPVLFIGFGMLGNGAIGESGQPGTKAIGVNTWDALGGTVPIDGEGNPFHGISAYAGTVGFMDFDETRIDDITCVFPGSEPFVIAHPVRVSSKSSMGEFNEANSPAFDCNGNKIQDAFMNNYCDFLPAGGDSGSPLFEVSPEVFFLPPRNGFHLPNPPCLLGVASERKQGKGNPATSVYGNLIAHTRVDPYLPWILGLIPELGSEDSDGDGQNDCAEAEAGTDPYDPQSNYRFSPELRPDDILRLYVPNQTNLDDLVEESTDLGNADAWSLVDTSRISTGIDAFGPYLDIDIAGAASSLFFRMTATPPVP